MNILNRNNGKLMSILFIFLAGFFTQANAQREQRVGIVLSSQFSGNGTGAALSPGLSLTVQKSTLEAGLNFQSNNRSVSGLNMGFRRQISLESESFSERTSLYVFGSMSYHHNASISNSARKVLENISKEQMTSAEVKFCIAELYAGAGINRRVSSRSSIFLNVGAGIYYTVNTSCIEPIPDSFKGYRSDSDISMMVRFGYAFKIN